MPSIQAMIMNKIFQSMPKDAPGAEHDYAAERTANASRPTAKPPRGITVEPVTYHGINGECVKPEKPNGKVIWYIHGGGFTTGSAAERRSVTFHLAQEYGFTVIANNYRLAPENKWPAGFDDCMAFFDGLVEAGYDMSNVYLYGESAGGTLVLSMGLRIRDEKKPMPAGIAAFSPCTDQAEDLPSHRGNAKTDYMLGDSVSQPGQYKAVFGEAAPDKAYLKDPYISPYYGDYIGLPPIFLAVSDYESLYDDSVILYQKLKESGHPVLLDTAHGVCHAYAMLPMMPEAKKTLQNAVDFLTASR